MEHKRREFIFKSTTLVAALSTGLNSQTLSKPAENSFTQKKVQWPILEGPDTPKLTLSSTPDATAEHMRRIKQLGADYVLMGGPTLPWKEDELRAIMARFKAEGLTVINMMLPSYSGPIANIIYGVKSRDADIEIVKDSIIAAGKAGLPIVEYNFYAHRLTEAYYRLSGRGGAGYTAYDYSRVASDWMYPKGRSVSEATTAPKDLAPLQEKGSYTSKQLWANLTYFLKAVIPVAEKAGVRMALHPNDPPAPVSRGSQQIMATFEDWKRLVNIVDSPSNGMTYDCGVSHEIGADPLEVLDYLLSRDRMNHVHYRNCTVEIPSTKYVEVFPDNGTVNMFAVMQQLVRRKYKFGLFAEHPRSLEYDQTHPEGNSEYAGWAYNQAYARAMMQAVLNIEREKA